MGKKGIKKVSEGYARIIRMGKISFMEKNDFY